MRNKKIYSLKGFTIIEVLISLALTSVAITLAYSGLNSIQKLFYSYKKQNEFITEYTRLKKNLNYESVHANLIIENSENNFIIKRDSISTTFQIQEKVILLKRNDNCDTFHLKAKKIVKEYELIKNLFWKEKLLNKIEFEIEFNKQKFNFNFSKKYDSSVKLELEQEK